MLLVKLRTFHAKMLIQPETASWWLADGRSGTAQVHNTAKFPQSIYPVILTAAFSALQQAVISLWTVVNPSAAAKSPNGLNPAHLSIPKSQHWLNPARA